MSRVSARIFLLLTAGLTTIGAQPYSISTYAGGAPASPTAVLSMATDPAGYLYFADGFDYSRGPARSNSVFRLDASGAITRFAGNSRTGFSGDGGQATSASLTGPRAVAADSAGNVFIVDTGNQRVRRVAPDGIITTVAGGGSAVLGDGGPATEGQLNFPLSIAIDKAGNLFIGEFSRVRKVSTDGVISTVAGGGPNAPADGEPATGARLSSVIDVAVDGAGNLFLADQGYDEETDAYGYSLRKVSPDGRLSTVKAIPFCCSGDITVDAAGDLLAVAGSSVVKIAADGVQTIVAGNGLYNTPRGDNLVAREASLNGPTAVAMNAAGDVLIADDGGRTIRKVTPDGILRAVAPVPGVTPPPGSSSDGGSATGVQLRLALSGLVAQSGLAVDRAGNLYIAETAAHRVRRVSPSGTITTVAGTGAQRCGGPSECLPLNDGGPAVAAALSFPTSVAADAQGNLFIADSGNLRVRKVSADGIITTVAGNGVAPASAREARDGAPATSAPLIPSHVAVDDAGNLYIVEAVFADIRKVLPDGTIRTVFAAAAGLPYFGYVSAMTADRAGNLFVAGWLCNSEEDCSLSIRSISPDGAITTIARGSPLNRDPRADIGDGGPASHAQLGFVSAIAVDAAGNVFLSDLAGQRVRRIDRGGIITTVGGNGLAGYSGDGGPAAAATLDHPLALAVDGMGSVYVSDFNQVVRVMRPGGQSDTRTQ